MSKPKKNAVTVKTLDGEVVAVVRADAFHKPKTRREQLAAARRTDHWRNLRHQALDRAGHRCEGCGKDGCHLEAHHLTYVRLGAERLSDVVILCQRCHATEHQWQKRHKKAQQDQRPGGQRQLPAGT